MGELIDKQAAIDELMDWVEKEETKPWSTFKGLFHWTGIKVLLEQMPSAQPELIRCRDCRYWREQGLCEKWDYYISNGDFYCGCAEQKEGGI